MRHASHTDASPRSSTIMVNSSPPYDSEITDVDIDPFLVVFDSSQSQPIDSAVYEPSATSLLEKASVVNALENAEGNCSKSPPQEPTPSSSFNAEIRMQSPNSPPLHYVEDMSAAFPNSKKSEIHISARDIFKSLKPLPVESLESDADNITPTIVPETPVHFLESHFYGPTAKSKSAKDILSGPTKRNTGTRAGYAIIPGDETVASAVPICGTKNGATKGTSISVKNLLKSSGSAAAIGPVIEVDEKYTVDAKDITSTLEDKIYGLKAKRTNPRDIFNSFHSRDGAPDTRSHAVTGMSASNADVSHTFLSSSGQTDTNPKATPILVDLSEDEVTHNDLIIPSSAKRTTAQDILKAFKPTSALPKSSKKQGSSAERASFIVTLKLLLEALQSLKDYDSPFRTRGNQGMSGQSDNDKAASFFAARPNPTKTNCFQDLMTASRTAQLTPLQKLKSLEPPMISRELMHVQPECDSSSSQGALDTLLRLREIPATSDSATLSPLLKTPCVEPAFRHFAYTITNLDGQEIPGSNTPKNPENLLWTNLFQPRSMLDLLVLHGIGSQISKWVDNAFADLKQYNSKDPRNVALARQRKKKQLRAAASQGFVIPDWDLAEDDMESDVFVPVLILQGRTGLCKSLSIYSIMHERGGYVHEINTSSERSRREIYSGLKEFCTTQIVHQRHQRQEFQEGLVLLEDVNILFELDKTFWTAVSDILNITRCPIVLTCETLTNIPKNILEICIDQNSIVRFDDDPLPEKVVSDYISQCALTQGYELSSQVLQQILLVQSINGQCDLRKSLLECQSICSGCQAEPGQVVRVEIIENHGDQKVNTSFTGLSSIANALNTLSLSDVISSSSSTLIPHAAIVPELIDIPTIDDSLLLRQPLQEFELDLGSEMQLMVERGLGHRFNGTLQPWFAHNQPRDTAIAFLGSRARFCVNPMRLQGLRRSVRSSSSALDSGDSFGSDPGVPTMGVSEDSILYRLPQTDIILDILPFCRQWYFYQKALDKIEADALANGQNSVKHFLQYRNFHNMSSAIIDTIPGYIS